MYSVVVAAVLSAGTPAPAFGGMLSQSGNCYGGCVGCTGYDCQGCNGCSGWWNNGFLGVRTFVHDLFTIGGCHGCSGCHGGCQGCVGMGCTGSLPMMSGMSCMGGCFGGQIVSSYDVPMGMDMGMGMPMQMPVPMNAAPIQGMPYGMPATPPLNTPPNQMPGQIPIGPAPQEYGMTPPNQATVVVRIPADARMFVNGQLFTLVNGPVRVFRTPELRADKRNRYTIRMELDRGGKVIDDTKEVQLERGKTSNVEFQEPGAGGNTARIDVTVPAGSTLSVEGQTLSAGQRSIVTPMLNRGQAYVYTLALQRDRNGQKETLTREVSFRAGEVIAVNFDAPRKLAIR